MSTFLAALPPVAQARAIQAIAEAFPDAQIQSLEPLHGGFSGALVYKLVVDERPYVLRIIMEHSPLHDPRRQLTCLQLASEQQITPPAHYINIDLATSITAYIAHRPATGGLRHNGELVVQLGGLLRRLHHGPAFPIFLDAFQMIAGGLEHLNKLQIEMPSIIQEVLAAFEPVKQALQPYLTSAPSHNDLNPGNVLYDGQRLWLIDWDAACMNDPMFDLASLMLWFLFDPQQEATLLHAYFEREPTERELAKIELMKHVAWWFYMLVFVLITLQGEEKHVIASTDYEQLPSFGAFMAAVGKGESRLDDNDQRRRLSQVLAKQSLEAMRQPAFRQALACLKAK